MNGKRLKRTVNISQLLGLGQILRLSLCVLSSRLSCLSPFSLSSSSLSLSGYLFPDLQEQTVMHTDVLWGVKLHIQLLLCISKLNNIITLLSSVFTEEAEASVV